MTSTNPPPADGPFSAASIAALQGVRVLDFSHALAGPYCTLLLAEYGAEIYKLEAPGAGDVGRAWGPPFVGDQTSFFLGLNRGKRGISIDLKQPEGIELCLRLIDHMDVMIENFRPGTCDRLGLGYAAVHARNPRLIYCSVSGYGQNGPARDEAAMDLIVQSSSGLLSITGIDGGERVHCGYPVADINAGLFATIGILMALRARERTGVGQLVDVSMFDCMISAMSSNFMIYLGSGVLPKPMGTGYKTVVPYRVFQAQDRDFAIAVGSQKLWSTFCRLIERVDLESHPDFATNALRTQHRDALEKTLSDIFIKRPMHEWLDMLRSAGIPCSVVRDFAEVVDDPQSAARDMFPTLEHPTVGTHRATGRPIKMPAMPPGKRKAAPLLGEDTRRTLAELLELDESSLDELQARGVIFEADAGASGPGPD